MADPELSNAELSPAESAKQELLKYMQGAEIGSPKLLAFSDVLQERELRESLNDLEGSKNSADVQRLTLAQMELALLRRQSSNRIVETKGYAKASDDIFDLISKIDNLSRRELLEQGIPPERIEFNLDDTYRPFLYGLFRALTTGEPFPEDK